MFESGNGIHGYKVFGVDCDFFSDCNAEDNCIPGLNSTTTATTFAEGLITTVIDTVIVTTIITVNVAI
jgi:hypothetical protein